MSIMKDDDQLDIENAPLWKIYLIRLLDHIYWTFWMTTLTIYALFGDDIRMLAFSRNADNYFYSASIVCLMFFAAELAISYLCKKEYRFSFHFWLDFIAMASLFPDIGFI